MLADVDGHDMGLGEINIFVHTDLPERAFDSAKTIVERLLPSREFKALTGS